MPFLAVSLLASLFLTAPGATHASMLSALAKFFGVYPRAVEEKLPPFISQSQAASQPLSQALDAANRLPDESEDADDANQINFVQDNSILAPLNPLGTMPAPDSHSGGQIFLYTIRSGDTISGIAKSFDVTVNTILWANGIADMRSLKIGDQVLILPVSGVRHEVKKGDTIASIASKYRATSEDIVQFNGLAAGEEPTPGETIIVPNGELPQSAPLSSGAAGNTPRFANLPLYEGFYLRPIIGGRRSRGIHGFNGVDLANSCGLPIMASADGTVIIARASGWNGGYGNYIVISHANGTQTLYSHMKEVDVVPGQVVRQGQTIGLIGSTGNSTGCHVHFEIRGAKNPF